MSDDTDDAKHFGKDVIVYCSQHGRPHFTGWCTVSTREKTKLESTTVEAAYDECRKCGYWLYDDWVKSDDYRKRMGAG